jgi:multidrug resistance efflux pump
MKWIDKKTLWGAGLALFLASGVLAAVMLWPHAGGASDYDPAALDDGPSQEDSPFKVEAIRPRNDLAATIQVQQPADVEAFYRADLAALVAGTVKSMPKGLNDRVVRDEKLIVIDVPDRDQEVLEMDAFVEQRKRERTMAEARKRIADAAVRAAEQNIKQKQAEVSVADADQEYRLAEYRRYRGLVKDKVVTRDLLSEKYKYYLVARAGKVSALVAVEKAYADLAEKKAQAEAANDEIELKRSLIAVASREKARAQAMVDYATIRAPFDGIIIKRNVDPGDFVQNAARGTGRPLLSVVRTDILTIVMKVPDTYARYVTSDTRAMIELPEQPRIFAKVTRFSPSIAAKDRTMRIEVDVFNGTREEYDRFIARGLSTFLPAVSLGQGVGSAALLTAAQKTWGENMKGSMDPLPGFAEKLHCNQPGQPKGLMPGMYGYMTLLLRDFHSAYLVPSKAVFSLGGKNYVLLVKNDRAWRFPVEVQLNDGQLAKVRLVVNEATDGGEQHRRQDLTGKEVLITANQTEIKDGQRVEVKVNNWLARPRPRPAP